MKNYSFLYLCKSDIGDFLEDNSISFNSQDEILIQVFTGIIEDTHIKQVVKDILFYIPEAKIIGTSTSGEVSEKGSIENTTLINISIFENTKIYTKLLKTKENSFITGKTVITELYEEIKEKPKVLISFSDGLNTNGEEYLKGIEQIDPELVVAGGMAADNGKFEESYIFDNEIITNNGVVIAALYNDDLQIYTDYNYNWKTLGKSHIVEKSIANRVYKIAGMNTLDFYAEYLAEGIKNHLPEMGIEFPLVIQENGENIARAVLVKHDDGSMSFAGNIKEGSVIKFGYGDVDSILKNSVEQIENIKKEPIEAIFVYSCMARKALLQENINLEILPLKEIAPISGCFTYGEFYHSKSKHKLLNQSMTILGISEKKELSSYQKNNNSEKKFKLEEKEKDLNSIKNEALSRIITKTTNELEELNTHLEVRVNEEIQKNTEKDNIMLANARHAQLGEIIGMIAHQWRQPLNAISSGISSLSVQKEFGTLSDEVFDDTTDKIKKYVNYLNTTIEDFRSFFYHDKQKEYISIEEIYEKASIIINAMTSQYDVQIQKDFSYEDNVYVNASEITQVFLIIIKNAIDAMLENKIKEKKVFIRSFEKDNFCVIEFEDIGKGIPKNILPKIFEKRFTTKGDTHGTGIGLDMSKTIIEVKMQGKIDARNGKDGAIISIYLPI